MAWEDTGGQYDGRAMGPTIEVPRWALQFLVVTYEQNYRPESRLQKEVLDLTKDLLNGHTK